MGLGKFVTAGVVGGAAVLISAMPGLAGQMPQGSPHVATAKATPAAGMAAKCQAMMADQEEVTAETKAADQRPDDLVGKMNAASDTTKADATAAVVNEMVAQREMMRSGRKMQDVMMADMVECMQEGADSMAAHTGRQRGAEMPVPHDMPAMAMSHYFSALNYPVPQDTMMVMLLADFQSARTTADFLTGMGMVQYGLTSRWTVGFMVEGQKISGVPTTYGGLRVNSYVRVVPHDHLLNLTLYGEYEGLNEAALYKMEVAGFGGEDLNQPLAKARRTPARTFELRGIVYHDWGRVNLTFNFVSETALDSGGNDFGYVWGVFRQPAYNAMETDTNMAGMPKMEAPPIFSFQRLGYGLEMMGALGNTHQFGLAWRRQQQYVGPVLSYTVSDHWTAQVESAFGLSDVSDPFVLRMGLGYSIDHLFRRRPPAQ